MTNEEARGHSRDAFEGTLTSRIAVVLAVLLAVLVPVPGQAVFHFANIDEIMSGKGGDSTAQYVEIRMLSAAVRRDPDAVRCAGGRGAQPPDGVQL